MSDRNIGKASKNFVLECSREHRYSLVNMNIVMEH